MEPTSTADAIKVLGAGGFGGLCLFTLIWVLRFTLTRIEAAIKENTEATRSLVSYFKAHNMYISGGKEAAE